MDTITELGELALASRLKRLSDRLMRDVSQVYDDLNIDFTASGFPLLYALAQRPAMAVTDLARALRLTHPAISQIARDLLKRDLIVEKGDPKDERKRLLGLSKKGRETIKCLRPVWDEIRVAGRELLEETGIDLLGGLDRLESALDDSSMLDRLRRRLNLPLSQKLEIVEYRPAYKKHFASLNRQWLEAQFTIEKSDAELLDDPNRNIIKRGGEILFARLEGHIVGTCALLEHPHGVLELAKMAVAEEFRGRGIGKTLADEVIKRARDRGAQELFLQTSPKLTVAGRFYRRLGFREVKRHPLTLSKHCRNSLAMRLNLENAVTS
ncbi:MAG: bifunctional helix-turn-helix transcriptional regulator/GNAT family N-acetyltransferase [Candidatus Eisenbacteria bacterium]|uniref:Bifunctional helix-turn-helix transcriptional regulator/GNAT family N-acetyltransferase n=1 Tax=Eiseniibacteriota bacterium TaxID=2212470 RepID=A0A948RTT1_UNCEI|nr:bifunctional helix-turn-helix transcriptional regulator/GNAT family N-acetyltransferase [Candidatus Eisenbacteria bacterium]MBU1949203.1 bifunctional helix-turn-helix transcriptional regulator/GNAT family N-acetyltransferase [Candidatus Eisenbacteria bacterium]MBU2689428.1 bifunctional helix-turn-helix transcriptional regulator/GNAT family N-acetyltransferase [Candidatus Eisenbacteria bacterium]